MSRREDELTENLRATLANDRLAEADMGNNEDCSNAFLPVAAIVGAVALPILCAIFFWGSIATIFPNFQRDFASADNHSSAVSETLISNDSYFEIVRYEISNETLVYEVRKEGQPILMVEYLVVPVSYDFQVSTRFFDNEGRTATKKIAWMCVLGQESQFDLFPVDRSFAESIQEANLVGNRSWFIGDDFIGIRYPAGADFIAVDVIAQIDSSLSNSLIEIAADNYDLHYAAASALANNSQFAKDLEAFLEMNFNPSDW